MSDQQSFGRALPCCLPWHPIEHGRSLQTSASVLEQEYIKEHFDPSKFTAVFSKEGKPPAWLEKLQGDPGGRQLIYDLSARHRGCLMLNYAIQKILYAGAHSPTTFCSTLRCTSSAYQGSTPIGIR